MKPWQGAAFNEPHGTPTLTVVPLDHGFVYITVQQPTDEGVAVARFCAGRDLALAIAEAIVAAAGVA